MPFAGALGAKLVAYVAGVTDTRTGSGPRQIARPPPRSSTYSVSLTAFSYCLARAQAKL